MRSLLDGSITPPDTQLTWKNVAETPLRNLPVSAASKRN